MDKKTIHIVSNTHWDREHRHSFQETRMMLVELMDELIEIMEKDPNYRYFTLDGQVILLHDYLEVKPHMRERLKKLIRDGRILIGPWYSLVDCFSVNPESIIRNLLYGQKVCSEFGEPMKVGYSIFSFGQIAQLPQIYNGFEINDIVFYKGASPEVLPNSEFIWKAPDGSRAFATRLGKYKRWNFFFCFTIPVILGGNPRVPGWQSKFTDRIRLFHLNDEQFSHIYANELQPDTRIREEEIQSSVEDLLSSLKESVSENIFLGFDGTDFTAPMKEIPNAIECANKIMNGEVELKHSNPVEYFNDIKNNIDMKQLLEYQGEMRFGPVAHLHSETMGSNVEIKQAMFYAENLLIHYAEPLSTFLKMYKKDYPSDVFELAWKYLLASQAHDSVHGAGDPQIKKDNLNRLEQVQLIAKSVVKRAVEGIALCVDWSEHEDDDVLVMLLNTTCYNRSESIKMFLDIPGEEVIKDYWLEDLDGNRLPMYQYSKKPYNLAMINRSNRPKTVYTNRMNVEVLVGNIPAMGYKLLKLKRVQGDPNAYGEPFPPGVFPYDPIARDGNVLDNGMLLVEIQGDGCINVHDLETGKLHKGLNYFTDTGCSGDFWVHREPYDNAMICSKGTICKISLIQNSMLSATYKVDMALSIPEGLNDCRNSRSKTEISMNISCEITLKKGSKRVEFKVTIHNCSSEHMVTASFPLNIQSEIADTDAPFEIKKGRIGEFTNNHGKKGAELERFAIQNFVDISDPQGGVMLMTKGLKEVGLVKGTKPVINLTLLRAVSGTFPIHDDLFIGFEDETSQCIGKHIFEYALFFHSNNNEAYDLIKESRKYITPLISAQIGKGHGGFLKGEASFIKMEKGVLNLSTIKESEDRKAIIIRVNNPTEFPAREKLTFSIKVQEAYIVTMSEKKQEKLEMLDQNSFELAIEPYKIETIYVEI